MSLCIPHVQVSKRPVGTECVNSSGTGIASYCESTNEITGNETWDFMQNSLPFYTLSQFSSTYAYYSKHTAIFFVLSNYFSSPLNVFKSTWLQITKSFVYLPRPPVLWNSVWCYPGEIQELVVFKVKLISKLWCLRDSGFAMW